jgi:superfamily II DNA or RNA helicase
MVSQPDIYIEPINASYIKIHTSESIKHELSDFYTFDLPGAQFMPGGRWNKSSKGHWDGKIRLYSKRDSSLPGGLLENLIGTFAKSRGYSTTLGRNLFLPNAVGPFSRDSLQSFIDGLNICGADGNRITPRPDQLDAIEHCIRKRRSLVLSPTASGKTLIGYILFQYYRSEDRGFMGLVLVPRIQLVDQLVSDWCVFSKSAPKGFTLTEENFQRIYGGRESLSANGRAGDTSKNRIVVSTWQSIYKLDASVFERFTHVLGDEAHEFKAKSLSHIMNSCVNAYHRTGLTGTLDGTATNKLVLEGLFGDAKKIISSRELMDAGHIAKLHPIKVMLLKHPEADCKALARGEGTYEDEIKYLVSSEPRNRFISKLSLNLEGNALILYQRVETHGEVLYNMMKALEPNRKIYFIHGGVDTDEREEVRRIVETEDRAIIVASYGTFSTGINIRNLHNVVFASPSKSRIRNLQSIGRGLRIGDAKDSATLFDIADDLRANPNRPTNFTYKHLEERLKIYVEEKFPYKIYKLDIGSTTSKVFS